MKYVRVLAASDRNNYGDLLFPIIVKEYMETKSIDAEFNNYGTIISDMTFFKGLKTKSIKDLLNDYRSSSEDSIIIIAGGEVLGSGWLNILRFANGFWNRINSVRLFRGFINKSNILNIYQSLIVGSSRPFILDGKIYDRQKIYYNAVGALGIQRLLNKPSKMKYFNEVGLLSIRDNVSKNHFDDLAIPNSLIPDSALIMSDLLNSKIDDKLSVECKNIAANDFAFVQLAFDKAPDDLNKFASVLSDFSKQNNLKIVLCPIGLALDHWDDKVLKSLSEINPEFEYYHPKNIYEIMFLIKSCSIYLGTSLHGLITAQSFNRPVYVFDQKVDKVKYYIDTWFLNPTTNYGDFFDVEAMNEKIKSFSIEQEERNTNQQKDMIYNNFAKIFQNV